MGYIYEVNQYYKIKCNENEESKTYQWPCDNNKNRKIKIYEDDILTIESEENGICNITKHTGIMCINILIPKDELEEHHNTIQLGVNV